MGNSISVLAMSSALIWGYGEGLYLPAQLHLGRSTRLRAVPEWLTKPVSSESGAGGREGDEGAEDGMITVRFINTVSQKDVVCRVEAGSNLLAVGDANGVKLPRACRTGLCGSCTCEVRDPEAIKTDTNPRDGFATIRACSTKCFLPPGEQEMVIDVYRMQNRVVSATGALVVDPDRKAGAAYQDPMARFSGNWEKEFRPSWDVAKPTAAGAGQVGGAANPLNKSKVCKECRGSGRCLCYTCNGAGRVLQTEGGKLRQCSLCVGLATVSCGNCRGTGLLSVRKKMPNIG